MTAPDTRWSTSQRVQFSCRSSNSALTPATADNPYTEPPVRQIAWLRS
nr:hypothetical protein [Acrocarpospora corrugata]